MEEREQLLEPEGPGLGFLKLQLTISVPSSVKWASSLAQIVERGWEMCAQASLVQDLARGT